jgi:hypothetical protein
VELSGFSRLWSKVKRSSPSGIKNSIENKRPRGANNLGTGTSSQSRDISVFRNTYNSSSDPSSISGPNTPVCPGQRRSEGFRALPFIDGVPLTESTRGRDDARELEPDGGGVTTILFSLVVKSNIVPYFPSSVRSSGVSGFFDFGV